MAFRRRHNQKASVGTTVIAHLMRGTGRDVQTLTGAQHVRRAFHLQHGLAFQHVKELTRTRMAVTLFGRARRHAFLDHAEIVPANRCQPSQPSLHT